MPRHPIRTRVNKASRRAHRWAAVAAAAPIAIVIATGLLLQIKKPVDWIQPPTMRGTGGAITLTLDGVLDAARALPELDVRHWDDIDRLDVRPAHGIVKVRAVNRWEAQLDLATGEPLHVAYRRSDLIERLHTGAFFGDAARYLVFLPAGVLLLAMWVTGVYLWALPVVMRRRSHVRAARRAVERRARGA
jgi:uncharacterized iron-regulated membrane protein